MTKVRGVDAEETNGLVGAVGAPHDDRVAVDHVDDAVRRVGVSARRAGPPAERRRDHHRDDRDEQPRTGHDHSSPEWVGTGKRPTGGRHRTRRSGVGAAVGGRAPLADTYRECLGAAQARR